MSILTLTGMVLILCASAMGQDIQTSVDAARLAEELTAFPDEDLAYEEIYENLAQVMANPININTATEADLRMLHVLSDEQIHQLIRYRRDVGILTSAYELQAIPYFDLETIQKIRHLVKVAEPLASSGRSLLRRIAGSPAYLMVRYERTLERKSGSGHEDPLRRFQGSDDKLFMRFRSSKPGDFSVGFTAEKDAGEQLIWHPANRQFGPDFLSCHAQLKDKGRLTNLVIGDFQAQFGQGLILGGPFGLGKGSESITTARRTNIGFLPYTSGTESGYFRGVANTVSLTRRLFISTFYSAVRRDATTSTDENLPVVTSLPITGLHRNDAELQKRGLVRQTDYGGVINFQSETVDAGVVVTGVEFNGEIQRRETPFQSAFTGKVGFNHGGFIHYRANNFTFFGEVAGSHTHGVALVAGALGSLSNSLDVAVLYRRYDKNYQSFHGNAFSENTSAQNERGFYWGWKYSLSPHVTIQGYVDLFRFPWLAFRRYAPTSGHEWLGRLNWQPKKKLHVYLQMREESKARNVADEQPLYALDQGVKRNYALNITRELSAAWKFRSRAQYSTYSIAGKHSDGLALVQDVTFAKGKFQVSARYALFETMDFDNRQYVYENDVWMAFSLPGYYGRGLRRYIVLEYQFNKSLSVWLRYAASRYTDRDEIGSGLETLQGNSRNDVKLQALFRF